MQKQYPTSGQPASTLTSFINKWKNVLPAGRYQGFYTEQTGTLTAKLYTEDDDYNILVTHDAVKIEETGEVVATFSFDANATSSSRWDTVAAVHDFGASNEECVYVVTKGTPGSGVPSIASNAVRLADVEITTAGINAINVASKVVLGLEDLALDQISDVSSATADAITLVTDNGMSGDYVPDETNPFATKNYVDDAPTDFTVSVSDNLISVAAGTTRKISGSGILEYAGTSNLVSDVSYTPGWAAATKYVIIYLDDSAVVDIEDNAGNGYDSEAAAQLALEVFEYDGMYKSLAVVSIATGVTGAITSVSFVIDVRDFMNSHRNKLRSLDWSAYTPAGGDIEAALGASTSPSASNPFATVHDLDIGMIKVVGRNWAIYNDSGNQPNGLWSDSKGYLGTDPVLSYNYIKMYVNGTLVEKDPDQVLLSTITGWSLLSDPGDWGIITIKTDGTFRIFKNDVTSEGYLEIVDGIWHYHYGSEGYYRPFAVCMRLEDAAAIGTNNSALPMTCTNGSVRLDASALVAHTSITTAFTWYAMDLSDIVVSSDWGIFGSTTSVKAYPFSSQLFSPSVQLRAHIYYGSSKETSRVFFAGNMKVDASGEGPFFNGTTNTPYVYRNYEVGYAPISADMAATFGSGTSIWTPEDGQASSSMVLTPSSDKNIYVSRTDDIAEESPAAIQISVVVRGFTFDIEEPYVGWVLNG